MSARSVSDEAESSKPVVGGSGGPSGLSVLNAQTVGRFEDDGARWRALERLAHKATAAKLARSAELSAAAKRLSFCGYVAHGPDVLLLARPAERRAGFSGLQRCRLVWLCPCCSPLVAEVRRGELNALLAWARASGLAVAMVTLTARHDARTTLQGFLTGLKGAKRRLWQRRDWKALGLVGTVTATEVTHGRNGWHPHFHVLVIGRGPELVDRLGELGDGWRASLRAEGLEGEAAAFHVANASAAGRYVGKFGAAEEIALSGVKRGRQGSRSPWELLRDASAGDGRAGELWQEFAAGFMGRKQLTWSAGLRAMVGLGVEDGEPAAEPMAVARSWAGSGEGWRSARRRRWALRNAAADGGDLDAAEFGPTDAAVWRGGEIFE